MFAGVDTHKDTLAVAVIDHGGRVVRQLELPNQDSGYARLLALLGSQATEQRTAPPAPTPGGRPPSTCTPH